MVSVPVMPGAYIAIFSTSAPFFNQIMLDWGPVKSLTHPRNGQVDRKNMIREKVVRLSIF